MQTSRTGTAKWKNLRVRHLRQARAEGLTNCPLCGTHLDWHRSRTPTSPELDHIIPHSMGGTDTPDNLRIICKLCNQRLGGYVRAQQRATQRGGNRRPAAGKLPTSQAW